MAGTDIDYYIQNIVIKDGKLSFDLRNKNEVVIDEFKALTTQSQVGETVSFSTKASGGTGDINYSLQVRKESNSFVEVASGTSSTLSWTPTESGSYDVKLFATDASGHAMPSNITYNVQEKQRNITTIYYKGYTNPNIHYRIGNGSWTSVPGVKMVECTDVAGYNYKTTIDLGQEVNLTACFNNGSGSWDSNNGSNYTFGVGNFTYESGKITPITIDNKISINSFTANPTSKAIAGQTVILNAAASNNNGDIQYKFSYKNNTTGEQGTLRDFSNYSVLSWLTNTVGNYTLIVEAKDSVNTAKKELNFTVEAFKELSITSVDSSLGDKINTNSETKFIISTDGGYGDNDYTLSVNGQNILNRSTSNTVNWKPTKSGIYNILVQVISKSSVVTYEKTIIVEDVASNIATIYYKGYDNPYIHYRIGSGSWTSAPGVKMESSSEVLGYNYKITIDLGTSDTITACFNNGSGSWDSNNGANYTFKAGTYYFYNKVIQTTPF